MQVTPKIAEIKSRREQLGLSRHQAALLAGLAGNSIYRIESGESKQISHLRAREIARVLNCQIEDICSTPERSA